MDKKAIALLRKSERNVLSDAELRYCIEKGVLWQPEMTHEECIRQIKTLAAQIPLERAVSAFLYSVESGDFRYRTILHSLLIATAMPEHSPVLHGSCTCKICGMPYDVQTQTAQPDMLTASRCRFQPETKFMDIYTADYLLNDLHAFLKLPEVHYGEECFRILNRILGLTATLAPANKVNALLKLIAAEESLSLTRADAFSILGVLSACGVFDTPDYKSDRTEFVPWAERDFLYETDIYYPLHLWKAKDGIRYDAIAEVFGAEIAAKLSSECADTGAVQRTAPKKTKDNERADAFFAAFKRPFVLDNSMRYYYGLAPLRTDWDRVVISSMKHLCPRLTELYFEGDIIRKMIHISCSQSGEPAIYLESDMETATNARRTILPKTARGREQPLTPSALQTPSHMRAMLVVFKKHVEAYNYANGLCLPLPPAEFDRLEDFADYTMHYIRSCPEDCHAVISDYLTQKKSRAKRTKGRNDV